MSESRWLSADEQEAWRSFMFASQSMAASLDRQMQHDAGMPMTYYVILAMLSEASERTMTMTRLADVTRSSPSKLSHAVARLEAQGWVTRHRDDDDGRRVFAVLTDAGLAELVRVAPNHVDHVRGVLFDHLSPAQVGQMREIFQAVLANLEEIDAPCLTSETDAAL